MNKLQLIDLDTSSEDEEMGGVMVSRRMIRSRLGWLNTVSEPQTEQKTKTAMETEVVREKHNENRVQDKGEAVSFEDQFKLLDLVLTEGGDQTSQQEKELLKPPQWPVSKPRKYICTYFNKEKIKIGATIQREEHRKKAEDVLQLKGNIKEDLTQEELEENTHKEKLKKE